MYSKPSLSLAMGTLLTYLLTYIYRHVPVDFQQQFFQLTLEPYKVYSSPLYQRQAFCHA